MKVIFLDIDGVLNTEVYMRAVYRFYDLVKGMKAPLKTEQFKEIKTGILFRDEYGHQFDPMAVDMFKWVVETSGAKIAISSTWRLSGLQVMKDLWASRQLPGEVIDITPSHMRRTGSTLQRGKEIDEWLGKHPEVIGYLIIDDDNDMEPEQQQFFVQTDHQYGLTCKDAVRCVEILNKELNQS